MFPTAARYQHDRVIQIVCDRVLVNLHNLVMANKEDEAVAMVEDLVKVIAPPMHASMMRLGGGFNLCFDSLRDGSIRMMVKNDESDYDRLQRLRDSQFAELIPTAEELRATLVFTNNKGEPIAVTPGNLILLETIKGDRHGGNS